MTRTIHRIRHHIARAAKALWAALGPVAHSVQGVMVNDDWKRLSAKVVAQAAGGAGIGAIGLALKDPEIIAVVVLPLFSAIIGGVMLAAMHHGSGQPAPTDPPMPPPESGAVPLADSPLGEKPAP